MNGKTILSLAVAAWACSLHAHSFKLKVDLNESPETNAVHLAVQKGAEKAAGRYFRFAERTHPIVVSHGFAAKAEQAKAVIDDDPLGDLEEGVVADDAIQSLDKDVEYTVRTNGGRKSFVLTIVNRKKDKPFTAEVELKRGKMFEPVYRRVYSEDGGKTWTTAAWQPPRASDVYPWTVEVPANSAETVTINLK